MKLEGTQQKDFHRALMAAFPTLANLTQMVKFGLDENLQAIAVGDLEDSTFELIRWAESQGRLEQLVNAALQHSSNPELHAFARELKLGEPPTQPELAVNFVHVLFMEIIGYSNLTLEDKHLASSRLQKIVTSTAEFQRGEQSKALITLETNDGTTALAFTDDCVRPLACARRISIGLQDCPEVSLRMGVNTGPVLRSTGLSRQVTVSGEGIDRARHIMEWGDPGHVLVSERVYELRNYLGQFKDCFHDLGLCEATKGQPVRIFNFYSEEFGKLDRPSKVIRFSQESATAPGPVIWEPYTVGSGQEIVRQFPADEGNKTPVQTVGVSHFRDSRGQEGLIYATRAVSEVPQSVIVPIKLPVLVSQIELVRARVEDLLRRALVGANRSSNSFESEALVLANQVLPPNGFGDLLTSGLPPQLDLIQDAASLIPWELLEERYFACSRCQTPVSRHRGSEFDRPFCSKCGTLAELSGGKIAVNRNLTHLVRGTGRPARDGSQFLLIADPQEDLCHRDRDPMGVCAAHLNEIEKLLRDHDYDTRVLKNKNATIARVLEAIADPTVVGIYYFGHGYFPRGGEEGCLWLADGPLYASQIAAHEPTPRFVLLNSCEGAASGRDWDFDKKAQSVASAFARGSLRTVVIAPLFPMVNVQAADLALNLLRPALRGMTLSEALRVARYRSLVRYEDGEPDLTWMAYRYFGDPNRTLPIVSSVPASSVSTTSRLFASEGELELELFAFELDHVLLRAAKRKIGQHRSRVSVADLCAGLLRKGDLMRLIIRQQELDPDELYEDLGILVEDETGSTFTFMEAPPYLPAPPAEPEAEPAPSADNAAADKDDATLLNEEERRSLWMAKWVVSKQEDLSEQAVRVLEQANQQAEQRSGSGDRRISEQDLLESLIADETWTHLSVIGLPDRDTMRRALDERERDHIVDENGSLILEELEADARRVIELAHQLSQQRGVAHIPNRLLLASFLLNEKSYAVSQLRELGVDTDVLFRAMIISTESESETEPTPQLFGLSVEACERIVMPVLEEARRRASNPRAITEADLFKAFCEVANPDFKYWLLTFDVDLEALKTEPDLLEPAARAIIETAHSLSQNCGAFPIPNRLLLASFLNDPKGHASQLFERHQLPASKLRQHLLATSAVGFARVFELDDEARAKVITPMIERAKELRGSGLITEQILFKAFCETCGLELKQALIARPWCVDLQVLGAEIENREKVAGATSDEPETSAGVKDLQVEHFEPSAWRVLLEAGRLAQLQGWMEIRSPHLFAALIGDGSGPVGKVLQQRSSELEHVKRFALALVPVRAARPSLTHIPYLSAQALQVVTQAIKIANDANRLVTEDDLLKAFFIGGGGIVGEQLAHMGLLNLFTTDIKSPETTTEHSHTNQPTAKIVLEIGHDRPQKELPALTRFGVDLTEKARSGVMAPIVGRDSEINLVMQTLLLTENANPLLVGESGIGKTAIVEGLAQRIAAGNCPKRLRDVRVVELSAGALVANTHLRGEFEQRMQKILSEAREGVILFIDEIHTIVGAGSAERSGLHAGNILKTALARAEVRLVGSTTHTEYKETISLDKALSRRFQVQLITPPSREATIQILSARKADLERHHEVQVLEDSIAAAVDLSGRYILDKQWPAKARDVLERACISASTTNKTNSVAAVTPEHVAQIVALQTGIRLERVSASELSALRNLEERLNKRVFGQPQAVATVTEAIRRGRAGLNSREKPWGSFMFIGPPGVGKTELALAVAEEVYGGAEGLIRFDMAQFSEPHTIAGLFGAPPGYVGYTHGAPLIERLRTHPYSLVLFDEIEYAHENVLAALLRLLSEGILKDNDGNIADARNAIVIMTSNFQSHEKERRPGFAPVAKGKSIDNSRPPEQAELRVHLEHHLQPKLIERLDAIVRFNQLEMDDLKKIAEQRVADVVKQVMTSHAVTVDVASDVAAWLVSKAVTEGPGARAIQRTVDSYLGNALGAFLNYEQEPGPVRIRVFVAHDAVQVESTLDRR